MSRIAEKRDAQREALIDAAERAIAETGLAALKARDLAAATGISLGGLYNLVGDLDEVVLRVATRTLARLDGVLADSGAGAGTPTERLVAMALAYCRFARDNLALWRALFEHRMASDSVLPDWQTQSQWSAFAHISAPLRDLLPGGDEQERVLLARTLFSAVHGVIALGLEEKVVAVPVEALEKQVGKLVRALCAGLTSGA
jgi:AcrR family transcriptional regulator